jgi:hypothetical protein
MNRSPKIIVWVVAATITLVAIEIGRRAAAARQIAEDETVRGRQAAGRLAAAIQNAEVRAGNTSPAVMTERQTGQVTPPPAGTPAVVRRGVTTNPRHVPEMEAIARVPWRDVVLEQDPALQAKWLALRRENLVGTYGAFWRSAALPVAQIEKFKDLFLEDAERMLHLKAVARDRGMAESDPAIAILREQARAQTRAAQEKLLGMAGFADLQEFERTLPLRGPIDSFAATLALAGMPITAAQTEQLVRITANASQSYREGARADPIRPDFDTFMRAGQTAPRAIDYEKALGGARALLTPAQFVRFHALIRYHQLPVELFNLMQTSATAPVIGFTFGRRL